MPATGNYELTMTPWRQVAGIGTIPAVLLSPSLVAALPSAQSRWTAGWEAWIACLTSAQKQTQERGMRGIVCKLVRSSIHRSASV